MEENRVGCAGCIGCLRFLGIISSDLAVIILLLLCL